MSVYWSHQPQIIVVFLGLALLTAVMNFFYLRRFDQYPQPEHWPRLSVLIPARNEAANIEACVRSLLQQDYPDFEVIVLNDHSTDRTPLILARLAREFEHLRVLSGAPLPPGWLGKHWACQQLVEAASGELLLLTDADTRHAPNTLCHSVAALLAEDADLVTAFPHEETLTWGERLIVPVIAFSIVSFLPLALVQKLRWSALSVSVGQFMLFRRTALEAIGGYRAVRQNVVDDVALGRLIIQNGFRWRLMDATHHVTCRMYHGFWDAVEGFTKNVFAVFDYHILFYLIAWLWVAIAFLLPPLVVFARAMHMPLEFFPHSLAVLATGEALLLWGIAYKRFGFPVYWAILYPLSLFVFTLIALRSLVFTLTGQAAWKERLLTPPAWRW
ncbi:MAG: glycosyltransferase [Anaerolineae bacterium]